MKKIAIYGKGGIGKSTIVSETAVQLSIQGWKVLQIGCDPKADSTLNLREGENLPTILDLIRERKDDFAPEEMFVKGFGGVYCVEAGGPIPGLGCAGRGIITALEKLKEKGVYDLIKPDVILYDVLGDVVCGGFSMPMRSGYADEVYIVTSEENMSIYAAANIATAIKGFKGRGYASLAGLILNKKNAADENKKVAELCNDFDTKVIAEIEYSSLIPKAQESMKTVAEYAPTSPEVSQFAKLAEIMMKYA